jgi:hypothetical protein
MNMQSNVKADPAPSNGIYRFMGLEVEIILASVSENSPPVWTVRMRYPRIIHGEIMTHRVFNRNARSSRAVPIMTMLVELRSGTAGRTFVPTHWGKNQKGMQASSECNEPVIVPEICGHTAGQETDRESLWLWARDVMCDVAEAYHNAGYHKQVANRLTEPFSYIDTLITATDWANFFHLRNHPDAEPHFRDLARLTKQAMDGHVETGKMLYLEEQQWHLPYITEVDREWALHQHGNKGQALLRQISSARCARISYRPFDGKSASYDAEIERYQQLVGNAAVHASPLEHQCTPDSMGLFEVRKILENGGPDRIISRAYDWENKDKHGSLRGWIQNRKLVPNEAVLD